MSYGWLTEQTIVPQQPKKIEVHNESSLIGLKSVMLSKKAELTAANPRATLKAHQPRRNRGVEDREKRDTFATSTNRFSNEAKHVESSLRIKEKLYSEMNQRGAGFKDSLVDFTTKKLENDDEYQSIRNNFYKGKLDELPTEGGELMAEQYRDRVNWEKKMLDELINGQKVERSMVQQSYEKGLSSEELEALKEVMKYKEKYEERLQALKRKGRELTEDRIRKLRKMNIIKEQSEQ